MNVIFLDIDGVLNSIESALVHNGRTSLLCPIRCGLVQRLATIAEARIVVSSAWRHGDTDALRETLRTRAGAACLVPYIIGETPRLSGQPRGAEIAQWLERHPTPKVERYVILDDDDDMLPGQPFVRTSFARGFSLDEYLDALAILKPGHGDLKGLAGYRGAPKQGWRCETPA